MILLKRILLLLLSAGSCISFFSVYADTSINEEKVLLPYTIEGTQLILEWIGSDEQQEYTEAVFYNNGQQLLESFYVELYTDLGSYYFETTMLPAGERILLYDRDGQSWNGAHIRGGECYYKTCQSSSGSDKWQSLLSITEGELIIKNCLSGSVEVLDIYLKPWDEHRQGYSFEKTIKISVRNMYANDTLFVVLPDERYRIVYFKTDCIK